MQVPDGADVVKVSTEVYVCAADARTVAEEMTEAFYGSICGQWRKGPPCVSGRVASVPPGCLETLYPATGVK